MTLLQSIVLTSLLGVFLDVPMQVEPSPATRKAVPGNLELWDWWFNERKIPYKFGDSTINQAEVRAAVAAYEQGTCLKFHTAWPIHIGHHLIFRHSSDTCFSSLGRQIGFLFGQDVKLTPACASDPDTVMRLVGRSLGLNYEQTRSDRDNYVTVMDKNIQNSAQKDFQKQNTRNFNTVYDYTSVFHFRPLDYSTGGTTMFAKSVYSQSLMSLPRNGLTFMDKLLINSVYECIKKWQDLCPKPIKQCTNNGYIGKDCSCVCPPGTSGMTCGTKTKDYTEHLLSTLTPMNEVINKTGAVTSPGYPTPQFKESFYTKVIKAPNCQRVKLTVTALDLASRCSSGTCCKEGVEIRIDPAAANSTWYCGTELAANAAIESSNSELSLMYFKEKIPNNAKKGYSFQVAFVAIPGCTG